MTQEPQVWYAGGDVWHTHEECRAKKRGKNVRMIPLSHAEKRAKQRCELRRCQSVSEQDSHAGYVGV